MKEEDTLKDYFSPNINDKTHEWESGNSCTTGSNAGSCVAGNSASSCVSGSSPQF
jgi:hypothetical protein